MSTGAVIGIVIAVIIVVAAVVVASIELRRARLRRQFGPEYDRLAKQLGGRNKADAELTARQRRVGSLRIHELTPEQQASYSGDWAAVQERFVDTPAEAVAAANTLIWSVMRDRGYPADNRDASMEALSFHHAGSFEGYRQTLGLRTEAASTEQLREAMIRYRALFEDLTGLRESQPRQDRVAEIRDRGAGTNPAVAGTNPPVAGTNPAVAGTDPAVADNRGRIAENNEVAAENRGLGARNSELAAEETNRTADTPR